jgi:AbrB family looped-hinge helix DNA binding protein
MRYETNMTTKGQITVPKDVRDLLGLKPGHKVQIETDPDGTVRIVKADSDAQAEQRKAEFLERMNEAQAIFAANDRFKGMDTDEFMALIREPIQPFEGIVDE